MQKHILIIENEVDIREILQEFFESEGFNVSTAEHGLEALETLERILRPDVILLDLMMPVMCGAEFIEHKNKNTVWKDIPVVVMSAADKKRQESMNLGNHWEIQKPLQLDDLITVIARAQSNET